MKRLTIAAATLLAFLVPASAADNYTGTPGVGKTFGCKDVAGVCLPEWLPVDSTAALFGVVGNPFFVTVTGTMPLPTGASTSALQTTGNTALSTINTTLGSPAQAGAAIVGQTASGSAVTGNPVRVGLSDGTNAQNWLTALALGDGVNGNNTGAVAHWLFNGTTWDRARGSTAGAFNVIRDAAGNARGANVDASNRLSVSIDGGTSLNANGAAAAANSSPVVQALDLAAPLGNIVANNTTAVVVNAAASTVYSIQLAGLGSAPAYLKLYNATSATCGSGTPVKRLMIPAAATAANGAGSNITFPVGVRFSTGLTYCVTTGIADNDTSAPAASTFLVNIDWH